MGRGGIGIEIYVSNSWGHSINLCDTERVTITTLRHSVETGRVKYSCILLTD